MVGKSIALKKETLPMKLRLAAMVIAALAAGAASAQPPAYDGSQTRWPGQGSGGFRLLQFDANADGKLTKTEFDNAQRARFNEIDANKDGTATREEFQAARGAEMEAHRAARAAEHFAGLDKDKNGQLSQAEFAAGLSGRGGHGPRGDDGPHQRMAAMRGGPPPFMTRRGAHGWHPDGLRHPDEASSAKPRPDEAGPSVTLAEFSAGPMEAFAQADTNKDGTVTIAELQAQRGGRR
jgi:hypothetical protein